MANGKESGLGGGCASEHRNGLFASRRRPKGIKLSRSSLVPVSRSWRSLLTGRCIEAETKCAASRGEHGALDQKLTNYAPAGRADGRADSDLALPSGAANEQEIGHVGACYEQHEADRAGQHQ